MARPGLLARGVCRKGHKITTDTVYFDREGYPRCKRCRTASVRKVQREEDVPRVRLPFAPLAAVASSTSYGKSTKLEKAYFRARRDGWVSLTHADELAIKVGHHPFGIWGWDFYAESQFEVEANELGRGGAT